MKMSREFFAALMLLPAVLSSQAIRGRVVDAESGQPLERAVVEMRQGNRTDRTLTSPSGVFNLLARGSGSFTIKVVAIGHRPLTLERAAGLSGLVDLGDIQLEPMVVTLAEINVRQSRECNVDPDSRSLLMRLLEGARSSLEVMSATVQAEQGGFRTRRIVRRAVAMKRDSLIVVDTSSVSMLKWPISSVGGDTLERSGFAVPGSPDRLYDWTWFGPDVEVLFTDWFLGSHCFSVESRPDAGGDVVISFEPAGHSNRVDISGKLVLDRKTMALRQLTFEHRNLPGGMHRGQAGGEIDFARLRSGAWLPVRWSIHAPIQTTAGGTGGMMIESGRVLDLDSTGAAGSTGP